MFKQIKEDWELAKKIAPDDALCIKIWSAAVLTYTAAAAVNAGSYLVFEGSGKIEKFSAVCFAFGAACCCLSLRCPVVSAKEKIQAYRLEHPAP
ncbi:MAG: hypothetical protein PHE27_06305 [Alphaproteobacteria bacterium]|nr:hypothetical protein [Alphaproteobacteria bacterium]